MLKKAANQKGSLSLSMIFSTTSGIAFVLMMYNLSSYVGSLGAVNESARATARCLTPTDPECVEVLSDANSLELDWYGRNNASGDIADISVRTFRYSASMQKNNFSSSFNTFRANAGTQGFSLSYSEVPLKTFDAYGQFEIPSGVKSASYQIAGTSSYTSTHTPVFPSFSNSDQRNSLNDWNSRYGAYNSSIVLNDTQSRNSILVNGNNDFESRIISVPTLDSNLNNNVIVQNCSDILNGVGSSSQDSNSCKNNAYLAIKAFARVRSTSGTTELKWGDGAGIHGLKVEIWNPDSNTSSSPDTTRLLGGQDSIQADTSLQWYNLWLRGAHNSHGGNTSGETSGAASNTHNNIEVPRGGHFKITAFIKNFGPQPADVDIRIMAYLNELTKQEQPPTLVTCAPQDYTGYNQQQATCLPESCTPINCSQSYCASNSTFINAINSTQITASLSSCQAEQTGASHTCTESEQTTPGSSQVVFSSTQAVCSDQWKPDFSGQTVCSWQINNSNTIKVGSANDCPLATPKTITASCDTPFVVNGTKANDTNCINLASEINLIRTTTQEINNTQQASAPRFGANPVSDLTSELTNISENTFWTSQDPQGGALPIDKKTDTHQIEHSANSSNNYFVRKDGTSNSPSLSEAINLVQNSNLQIQHNWDAFIANASSLINTSKSGQEAFKIEDTYPFDSQETEEIYYGQTDATAGWDFQIDCNLDSECENESLTTFDNSELMLRSFASATTPQAANQDFVFNSHAELIGFKQIGQFPVTNPPQFQACYPTRVVCSEIKSENDTITFLGRTNTKPELCSNYSECFAQIPTDIDLGISENEEIINTELAKQAGLVEIRRLSALAYTSESCAVDEANCMEINIDTSTGEKALVEVSYNMPISFPLSTILQKNSIKLSYTKEETIERSFAGNSNY